MGEVLSRRSMLMVGAGGLASILVTGGRVSAADSQGGRASVAELINENDATRMRMEALIAQSEQLLQLSSDGTLVLKPEADLDTMDPELARLLVSGIIQTNLRVQAGEISVDGRFAVHSRLFSIQSGVNSLQLYWWGFGLALSTQTVQRVVNAIQSQGGQAAIGTVVGVISALLTDGASAAVLASAAPMEAYLVSLGAGFLQRYSSAHSGIIIWHTWWGNWWITGQN